MDHKLRLLSYNKRNICNISDLTVIFLVPLACRCAGTRLPLKVLNRGGSHASSVKSVSIRHFTSYMVSLTVS